MVLRDRPRDESAWAISAVTLARVMLETPAPPNSFGTLMPHRPERENTSSSGKGSAFTSRKSCRGGSWPWSLATMRACLHRW